jgi:hypothetical protein
MRHNFFYFLGVTDESVELSTRNMVQEQMINIKKFYK